MARMLLRASALSASGAVRHRHDVSNIGLSARNHLEAAEPCRNHGAPLGLRGSFTPLRRSKLASRRAASAVAAKRRDREPSEVEEGMELDADLRAGLNELSNEAIRVMLADDPGQLRALQDKVDATGEYLVGEQLMDAATFMFVLRGMLEHQLVPEAELLKGLYQKAFEKIGGVMEDSGWLLAPPEAEGGNVEMVDDELIPPVLQRPY